MTANRTPEEQAMYVQQLQAQMNEIAAEINRLQAIRLSHQDQIDRYTNFETAHPIFKKFVDRMINETKQGIQQIDSAIAEYQNYKLEYIAEMRSVNPAFQG